MASAEQEVARAGGGADGVSIFAGFVQRLTGNDKIKPLLLDSTQ